MESSFDHGTIVPWAKHGLSPGTKRTWHPSSNSSHLKRASLHVFWYRWNQTGQPATQGRVAIPNGGERLKEEFESRLIGCKRREEIVGLGSLCAIGNASLLKPSTLLGVLVFLPWTYHRHFWQSRKSVEIPSFKLLFSFLFSLFSLLHSILIVILSDHQYRRFLVSFSLLLFFLAKSPVDGALRSLR